MPRSMTQNDFTTRTGLDDHGTLMLFSYNHCTAKRCCGMQLVVLSDKVFSLWTWQKMIIIGARGITYHLGYYH